MTTNKAEILLKRTKATYYEHGERTGHLLASQLKHQAASHLISQIYDSSNNLTTNPDKIYLEFASFYSYLYKSKSCSDAATINNFLSELEFPKLNSVTVSKLDEPLSTQEIASCILTMKSNKAPGPDGFQKFLIRLIQLLH